MKLNPGGVRIDKKEVISDNIVYTTVSKERMKMKVAILATDNCLGSSISGPFDILSIAGLENPVPLFEISVVSIDGRSVSPFSGPPIPVDAATDQCSPPDIIFIPVIYGNLDYLLSSARLSNWLIRENKRGAVICAVCAGVFLIAGTGLLDKRQATTHWYLADQFSVRFPKVILKKEKMIVDQGDIITAGGVTAYMDLSLYIVSRFASRALAAELTRMLLIDPVRQSQSPYTSFELNTSHSDKPILNTQAWMKENMTAPITVSKLATIAGLGERTFARRFKKATGDTPLEYLQHLRIATAKSLLETTNEPVGTIVYRTGYEDSSSFRRLFKRATGLSPVTYRTKFSII